MVMLPRLQAEESLRRVMEIQATMPEVERSDRERIIRELERLAAADREPQRLTPNEMAVRLALLGIGIKKVSE